MKNLKIGKRLIVSFVIAAIISSISGVLGVYLLNKSDKDYSHALENYGFASGKIGELASEINKTRAYIRDIVFLTEPDQLSTASKNLQDALTNVDALLKEVEATNTSDKAKTLFAEIEADIKEYRQVRDQVVSYGMDNKREEAYGLWIKTASPMITSICEKIEQLLEMNYATGEQVSNDLTRVGSIMSITMVVVLIIGFAIAIAFAIYISRGISKPLVQIEEAAEKISKGDFETDITYESSDEIGLLADSMRNMVSTTSKIINDLVKGLTEVANGNFDVSSEAEYVGVYKGIENAMAKFIVELSVTLQQVKDSSDQVLSGSDQVASSSQALAQGATEQASSVEELSASINEVAEQVKSNATNANNANNLAGEVGANIQASHQQMTQMVAAMNEISDSSSQISKIIKTIEDIAFQTNILALNAAVEAARAGAAGKGFAVVADEVRNLATKSSEAAKQTNALIESSVTSVEGGVKIAAETAKSLTDVVEGAGNITALIGQISEASSEQANSIAQINLGVEQISAVVQTNSATSEESAAASEELNSQAAIMKSMVEKFNLKKM